MNNTKIKSLTNIKIIQKQDKNLNDYFRNKRLKELEAQLNQPLSNQELLKELGERLRNREIVGMYDDYASLHVRKYPKLALSSESDNEVIFKLHLSTGKVESQEPIILFDEYERKDAKLVKISGILTSQIRSKPSRK